MTCPGSNFLIFRLKHLEKQSKKNIGKKTLRNMNEFTFENNKKLMGFGKNVSPAEKVWRKHFPLSKSRFVGDGILIILMAIKKTLLLMAEILHQLIGTPLKFNMEPGFQPSTVVLG